MAKDKDDKGKGKKDKKRQGGRHRKGAHRQGHAPRQPLMLNHVHSYTEKVKETDQGITYKCSRPGCKATTFVGKNNA